MLKTIIRLQSQLLVRRAFKPNAKLNPDSAVWRSSSARAVRVRSESNMKLEHIESKFAAMGARLKVRAIPSRWRQRDRQWLDPVDYAIDIQHDRQGEFFELRLPTHLAKAMDFTVLNAKPERQHLLLLARKVTDKPQTAPFPLRS